jgi:HD-GYP domain-containing protein (c-di-GMP phosphodiesterase class II)
MAAPLHDIGKIVIPDAILKKASRLTLEEYGKIKEHAASGGRIIRETLSGLEEPDFVLIAEQMASYHHEKWAGGGYPDPNMKGKEIPLCARILTVADVFDALCFRRQYKGDLPTETVFAIMEQDRGFLYDPEIWDSFLEMREELQAQVEEMRREEHTG